MRCTQIRLPLLYSSCDVTILYKQTLCGCCHHGQILKKLNMLLPHLMISFASVIATLCNFPVVESFFGGGFTHIQMRVVDLLFWQPRKHRPLSVAPCDEFLSGRPEWNASESWWSEGNEWSAATSAEENGALLVAALPKEYLKKSQRAPKPYEY